MRAVCLRGNLARVSTRSSTDARRRWPVGESPVGPWWDRLIALVPVGAATWVVALLVPIEPDPRGYGTHEALGWEPCGWPSAFGIPCPTCGATTAACHVLHLHPLQALAAHPFGAAMTVVGLWIAVVALLDIVRGRSFVARTLGLRPWLWLGWGLLLLLASWGLRLLTW